MHKLSYTFIVLKKRGIRFLLDYFLQSLWFDIRYGTSTAARVPKDLQKIESTEIDEDNGLLYVASFTSVIQDTVAIALNVLGPISSRVSQFIDLGCGKGKALLVYSRNFGSLTCYPAVGIEYDPILCHLALDNVEKIRLSLHSVKVVNDSAINVRKYLSADCAIIYIYNSFQGQTFISTLSSLRKFPHVLIYIDPVMRSTLSDFGYRIIREHSGRYNADSWLIASSPELNSSYI